MGALETGVGKIGVAEEGGGDRLPLVLLHGVGSNKRVWAPQLEHFGRFRRTVALDYPGYGDSGPAAPGTTRDDFAAAIWAALDTLGIGEAHLCGLSLGGIIAIAMHTAAPARCRSLVLADTFAVHPDGPGLFERAVESSRSLSMQALAEARAPLLLAPDTHASVREDVVATMAGIDPEAYRLGAEAVWLADQRDRVARIHVPTLVLVGTLDPVTPPALSEELATVIAGARLQQIEGASHLSNLDRPDAFNRAVDDFLSQVESGS
jgi:3-oxoadipate enol-lactonase